MTREDGVLKTFNVPEVSGGHRSSKADRGGAARGRRKTRRVGLAGCPAPELGEGSSWLRVCAEGDGQAAGVSKPCKVLFRGGKQWIKQVDGACKDTEVGCWGLGGGYDEKKEKQDLEC